MNEIKELTGIYHEQQKGALCGQHALNSLLQEPRFSWYSLAEIAQQLDIMENKVVIYRPREATNMEAGGFCNIQVLQHALQSFNLELISYESQSPLAQQARAHPETIQAYICNVGEHWSTIRRFGRQYFDLNSMFSVPRLIPEFQLEAYLKFIRSKHYSIFIVDGELKPCLADTKLQHQPVDSRKYLGLSSRLPLLCIDEKLLQCAECGQKHGNLTIRLPQDLIERYQKNPSDPEVLALIRAQLPEEVQAQIDSGQIAILLGQRAESQFGTKNKENSHREPVETSRQRYEHIPQPAKPESDASLQLAIAQSLLEEQERKLMQDAALRETQAEKLNDLLLDEAIAESLASIDVGTERPVEAPQPVPSMNSSASAPPTAIIPPVREVKEVSPPMAHRAYWPSFEETRQRRLENFGNRHVSIINRSCPSPTD